MELDKTNAVLMGVCAGFARSIDVDPFLVRITAVLVTLFFAPLAIPAYLFTAALLRPDRATRGPLGPFATWCSAARPAGAGMGRTSRRGLWSTPFAASEIAW